MASEILTDSIIAAVTGILSWLASKLHSSKRGKVPKQEPVGRPTDIKPKS